MSKKSEMIGFKTTCKRLTNEVNHVNLYVLALLCRYKTRIREAVRMLSDETSLV